MRDSEVGSLEQTHLMGHKDSRSQNHKGNNSFVIREVPIQRTNIGAQRGTHNNASSEFAELSKGKSFRDVENVMMDYDTPELVVFLQEDRQVSMKGKGVESNSESYEETRETVSSISNVSDSVSRYPRIIKDATDKCGFRNLMMMMVEGDHPAQNTTSETHEEVIGEEEDFPRLFNNWQNIDSILRTISSRMEFSHCADCQQFPETGSSQRRTLDDDGDGNHGDSSSCAIGTPCTGPATTTTTTTKSRRVSHQSSDSISSAHSFTFPILPTEWTGSPVRMAEAERTSQSRRHRWRKIFFNCCKF